MGDGGIGGWGGVGGGGKHFMRGFFFIIKATHDCTDRFEIRISHILLQWESVCVCVCVFLNQSIQVICFNEKQTTQKYMNFILAYMYDIYLQSSNLHD